MPLNYQKIILPTRPQADTIVGIFLLKKFGREKYPGIEAASVEIWGILPERETPDSLANKGFFLIDIGEGKFDHHIKREKITFSQLIAEDLGITGDSNLTKLLTYAERDDKYGLGTISKDSIDKAFGLSALITNLNKIFPTNPQKVVELILPILDAHYREERRRSQELPKEFEEALKQGKAEVFFIRQKNKKLKIVILASANPSMAGWLRSGIGEKADVVVQKIPTGHINILTRPLKKIDLRWLAALLRNEEAILKSQKLKLLTFELMKPGRIPEIPEWYYDRATNSILNGGVNPQGIPSTAISLEKIKELLQEGLSRQPLMSRKAKSFNEPKSCQYFLEIRLPLEEAKKIREMLKETPAGIKLHLPENYHFTLMVLGSYNNEEIPGLFGKIQLALVDIKPFSVTIDSQNFKAGKVPGYPTRAFYFLVNSEEGEDILRKIRLNLEKFIPHFQPQGFFPHLTVATALPMIEEKIIDEANIKIKDKKKVKFLVHKIRLTQILRRADGSLVYKAKNYFPL